MAVKANPPKPNEKGQTDSDRGSTFDFSYPTPSRKTGKVGGGSKTMNDGIPHVVDPKGKPRK